MISVPTVAQRNAALLVLLGGLLHAFSLAWPFDWGADRGQSLWGLQVLALCIWSLVLLQTPDTRSAALVSWCFGLSSMMGSTAWLHEAMYVYGGLPWILSVLAVAALAAFLALYYAAAGWLWHLLGHRRDMAGSIFFAATLLGGELARGQWLGGFGWGSGAYAHIQGPWSAWFALGGAYAVVFLFAGWCMAVAQWVSRQNGTKAGGVRAVAGWSLLLGSGWLVPVALQIAGPVRVALIQGNVAQSEKFEPNTGVEFALGWYRQAMTETLDAGVVIAPETALPVLPSQLPSGYLDGLNARLTQQGRAALVGMPMGSYEEGYTNSVVGMGVVAGYRYDKHHLVPFGEFIPPFFRWFMRLMHIPLGDFSRGGLAQPSAMAAGVRWGVQVCFEDVFSEELATRFAVPESAPQVMVNVSNLAWFGDSAAPYQHLNIARVRSMEFGRPTVRVANTGITAVVDAQGRVRSRLPSFERGILQTEVVPVNGMTPYALWSSRWGQWPLWGVVLVVCAAALAMRPRGRT